MSAYRDGDRIVVLVPARLSREQERGWVERMVADVTAREERARTRGSRSGDDALLRRAKALNLRYLGGPVDPASVRWVPTMAHRWGSCTAADRTIRLSDRLRDFPDWVVDYVLVHELAHLTVGSHGPQFWALVARYDASERARGFLEGFSAAAHLPTWDDEETRP
ncbi:MAG: M48 family metallopeptidase [bacterium]